jgi:hypothetical protein
LPEPQEERAMELDWWSDGMTQLTGYDLHPERQFTDINITGADAEDKRKLDQSEAHIIKFVQKEDMVNGYHFHFEDQARYWTMIRALEICGISDAKCYTMDYNNLWIFNIPIRVEFIDTLPRYYGFCGTGDARRKENLRRSSQEKQVIKDQLYTQNLEKAVTTLSFSWFLFLLMAYFSIRKLIN